MAAKHCDVCHIDLENDYAYQGHIAGKKHANNLRYMQFKNAIEERSIFVSNWPPYFNKNELLNFFLKYGPIEGHKFERGYASIRFSSREPVQYLTTRPIMVNNHKLHIKRRIFHENKKPANAEDTNRLTYEDFRTIFEGETTFDSQLIAFLNAIQQNEVTVESEYESVRTSLNQIFRDKFKNCKAHRYGSTVTGLSFRKSDIDVYMDIGLPICESEDRAPKPNEWTPKQIFRAAKTLLFRRKNIFTDIVLIPNAKTPIIKFRHVPTGILCDISFKNSLGVHNSHLIKHYLSLDVRLKPLMIIIKFWAHLFGIAGMGKISNYALVMLIIFFLQQPERSIVPTVLELQATCVPISVQDWQVNYDKNIQSTPIENDTSIPELLHGFFDFYASLDLSSKVICPLNGETYPRSIFTNTETLPASMFRYKEYLHRLPNPIWLSIDKPMCLQDPIELNHNLTAGVSARAVDYFQKHCATSRQVCQEAQESDYKNLFSVLFTRETSLEKDMTFKLTITGEQFLKIGLPPNTVLQPGVIYRNGFTIESWHNAILNLLKDVFEKVLRLEVKLESSEREAKQQKCDVQSDVHSKDNDKIVLQCSGYYKLWQKRKSKKLPIDPTMNMLEKEADVSCLLIEELKKQPASSVPVINFICIIEKQQKPVALELTVENNKSAKNVFKEFHMYVSAKLQQIIDKTLQHMLQFKEKPKTIGFTVNSKQDP